MGKDPGVEVGGQAPLIEDVAALAVEARAVLWGADDLVIGKDALYVVAALDGLLGELGARAVCADDHPGPHPLFPQVAVFAEKDDGVVIIVVLDPLEAAGQPVGARLGGPLPQPFVEDLPVDHADKAALDGHVHRGV